METSRHSACRSLEAAVLRRSGQVLQPLHRLAHRNEEPLGVEPEESDPFLGSSTRWGRREARTKGKRPIGGKALGNLIIYLLRGGRQPNFETKTNRIRSPKMVGFLLVSL